MRDQLSSGRVQQLGPKEVGLEGVEAPPTQTYCLIRYKQSPSVEMESWPASREMGGGFYHQPLTQTQSYRAGTRQQGEHTHTHVHTVQAHGRVPHALQVNSVLGFNRHPKVTLSDGQTLFTCFSNI